MGHIISSFDEQFGRLHARSSQLLERIPHALLFQKPRESAGAFPVYSCGEHLLRSAAAVEQTFGGLTANLWDDPFEWTLPETLSDAARIDEYLSEVEATRRRGFELFGDDGDLGKEIAAPAGGLKTIFELLLETLVRATHHQGRAFAAFRHLSDARLPPV